MSLSEVAIRRAVALAAASALILVLFPAGAGRSHVVVMPALLAVFLLGCAGVLLSPAHRAVGQLARRAAGAARELRRVGFTGIVLYRMYVLDQMRKESAAAVKEVSVVHGILLFLVALWTVNLSVLTGTASGSRRSRPADGGGTRA